MAEVLDTLLASDSFRIVRVKDRANHVTSMNWMDVMVNVTLGGDGDHNRTHVCEIQIAHAKMLLARSGLGGHGPYNQMRAASEILALRTHTRAENVVGRRPKCSRRIGSLPDMTVVVASSPQQAPDRFTFSSTV